MTDGTKPNKRGFQAGGVLPWIISLGWPKKILLDWPEWHALTAYVSPENIDWTGLKVTLMGTEIVTEVKRTVTLVDLRESGVEAEVIPND